MAVTNNILHTTYEVSEDPFDGVTLTVTCDDGYTFDGTPTIDYTDNMWGDEHKDVKLTVDDTKTVATITSDEIDSDTIVINGNVTGGSEPVVPTITNNVEHTTYELSGDTLTLTCDSGYVFDGTPTVTIDGSYFGDDMNVSSDKKIAELTQTGLGSSSFTIDGSTKEEKTTPTEPTIDNNVSESETSYKVDGEACVISITNKGKYVLNNINVSYTNKQGESKTVSLPVETTVNSDTGAITSTGSVSIQDVDYSVNITIDGDSVRGHIVIYVLSGCASSFNKDYVTDGEVINVTLTAETGNEFTDASKQYIEPQGYFVSEKVILTISDDKQTANGSYTVESQAEEIYIAGDGTPKVTPTAKYGFINAYVVTEGNLNDFATKRFVEYTGESSIDTDPISYDMADYVNRVKRFFFDVPKGTSSKLKLGNFVIDTDVSNLAQDTQVIDFGSVDVPNVTNSAVDYETNVSIFVPFVGLVSVDSFVIGRTVSLTLEVNLLGGSGVYKLTCDDNLVWTDTVEPNTDVLYRTSKQQVEEVGSNKFNASYLMGLKPYLLVDVRSIVETGEVSSSRTQMIGDITGHSKVTDVRFADTTGMLQSDIEEITQILRSGFSL